LTDKKQERAKNKTTHFREPSSIYDLYSIL